MDREISIQKEMLRLFKTNKKDNELIIFSNQEVFKIDLKPENLQLWEETYMQYSVKYNLLLACESDNIELPSTRLTWVVGSAIRGANVKNIGQAIELLLSLGASKNLAIAIESNCPGLGSKQPWAFYLERHGWLTASPVMNSSERSFFLK